MKTHLLIWSLALSLLLTATAEAALVAEWRFDESAYNGTSGEVVDESSNNLDGTAVQISSSPTTSDSDPAIAGSTGTCGYATFDTANTYIEVPDPGTGSVLDLNELTITTWVYFDALPVGAADRIASKESYELLMQPNGRISFSWETSGGMGFLGSDSQLVAGQWYHIAVTRKPGSGQQVIIYIDGVQDTSVSTQTGTLDVNNLSLAIGSDISDLSDTPNGRIDELRLYDAVLNSTEINTVMNETHSCTVLDPTPPSPIAEWRFDDAAYNGTSGEVVDNGSNSLDGTAVQISSSPTTSDSDPAIAGTTGTCGYATFDTANTYIEVPDPGTGSVLDLNELTITAWVYFDALPVGAADRIVSKSDFDLLLQTNGRISFSWNTSGGIGFLGANTQIVAGQWYHVAVTRKPGSGQQVILYLDGVADTSSTDQTGTVNVNNNSLHIGTDADDLTDTMNGRIDELRIYNEALNSAQVTTIMNETHSCAETPPSPIAEWRFDESSYGGISGEVVDESSNSLDGTAVQISSSPTTSDSDPAIAGATGTCGYATFDTENTYLEVPDPGTGSVLDLNELTMTAWVYFDAIPIGPADRFLSKGEYELLLQPNSRLSFYWKTGGGNGFIGANTTIVAGQWYHIAVTREPGQQVILYIDGVADATSTAATGTLNVNNTSFHMGTGADDITDTINGRIDEARIYNEVLSSAEINTIMNETHLCVGTLDHFDFTMSTTASVCSPLSITITAKDSSNATLTSYTGTITLSTSTNDGDWSKTATPADALGTLTPGASDSGSASYIFSASDSGVITLELENSHAQSLTVSANDSSASVTSTSATTTFSSNAFEFTLADSDIIAGRDHTITVNAIKVDASTGKCSVATGYSQTGIKAYITRSADDPGGVAPTLSATTSVSLPNSLPGSNNITVPFSSGTAALTLQTSDVGQYAIYFRDDSLSYSSSAITGNSAELTVRPFGFYISASSNPAADSATGAVYTTAGTNFSVDVSAVGWASADDANSDGIPDNHDDSDPSNNANLSNNSVLAAFGQEGTPETVTLSSTLILPSGGTDGGLADGDATAADGRVLSSFSSGADSSSSVYFAEVGIIEIQADISDGDYLGIGSANTDKAISQSGYVGRFYPDAFSFSSGSLTAACTSGFDYSYMGQSFATSYTLTALNTLGSPTTNYEGDFAKLTSGSGSLSYTAIDAGTTLLSSRLSASGQSYAWLNGVGTLAANLSLARASSPDGPYDQTDIGLIASDGDSVSIQAGDIDLDSDADASDDSATVGQTEFRFGRLRLTDAFGPETASLPVNFQTEHWDGSVWTINSDDDCTTIATSEISYPDGTIDTVGNRSASVGAGTTTGSYTSISSGNINFTDGDAGHAFSAPGSGNTGAINVDVDLSNYSWLRFDWDNDGAYTDTALPTATYTFGTYRGHDRVIYWREILE